MADEKTPADALFDLIDSRLLDVNTCIPAIVTSYENGRASVQPTARKRFADGDVIDYPIIQNVPVNWPSFAGGSAGIKGPVRSGDTCLLVFAQQARDGSDDRRMFDLTDAYCVMLNLGSIGGDAGNNSDMTIYFGGAHIRITEGGRLDINAPGGVGIKSPQTDHNGAFVQSGGVLSSNGVALDSHTHGGVIPGSGSTGAPN
ncbi:MAG: Gp138 family membrane-puncturing spike protein [Shewanella oncorhynchi]